jgi:hypothetical protein
MARARVLDALASSQGRGGGARGGSLSVRDSSPPMNSMPLCGLGILQTTYFGEQAGIGADGLSGCVFVPSAIQGQGGLEYRKNSSLMLLCHSIRLIGEVSSRKER